MAITKVTTPDLIDLPTTISSVETNTDGVVLAKGSTSDFTSVEYLVVAGGGGGGYNKSGGGGAGGYRNSFNSEPSGGNSTSETALSLPIAVAHAVVVGVGGLGSTSSKGGLGGVSKFGIVGSEIISDGGGGGGSYASNMNGESGGSGGGGAGGDINPGGSGGIATANQGLDGGNGTYVIGGGAAGGGGGAGVVGANAVGNVGGAGGDGLSSSITGSPVPRGGGGGGSPFQNTSSSSAGGNGGGGASSTITSTDGVNGTPNTGGGGGGNQYRTTGTTTGGNGGSGVVILRTVSTTTATFSGGVTYTLDNTTVAGQNIYTITATTDSSQTVTFSSTVSSDARPVTGGSYILEDGEFRYNTTDKKVEYYDGADWFTLTSTTAVPQAGTTGVCNYPTTATALYQLNDNANDTCGSNNAVATNITYTTGKFGNAAVFSGSSSYITTPVDFSTFTDYSVSMWIYPTATGAGTATGTGFGGTVDAGTDYGFFLSINSSNQIRFYERTGSPVTQLTSSNAVTLNTWNNIVAIRDGSTNYIYVNNIATSLANYITITYTSDFIFGRAGLYASDSYTGNIDQARIFPSALTSAQVTALYEETAP